MKRIFATFWKIAMWGMPLFVLAQEPLASDLLVFQSIDSGRSANRELLNLSGYYFYLKQFDGNVRNYGGDKVKVAIKDEYSIPEATAADYVNYVLSTLHNYEEKLRDSNLEICRNYKSEMDTIGQQPAVANLVVAYSELDREAAQTLKAFAEGAEEMFVKDLWLDVKEYAEEQASRMTSYTSGMINVFDDLNADSLVRLSSGCESID